MILAIIHEDDGSLRVTPVPSWMEHHGDFLISQSDVHELRRLLMDDLTTELDLVHANASALGAALTERRARLESALRASLREVLLHNQALGPHTTPQALIDTWTKLLEERSWP